MSLEERKSSHLSESASWLESRLKLSVLADAYARSRVPRERRSFWFFFGGMAVFFFCIQLLTGTLLSLYYSPTPETANESVHFIVDRVAFGWFVRSIHAWSAHLLVGSVLIHFFSAYFMRAYRTPREITWLTGVVLLMLVLGFGFTGYLLPWDMSAYAGTQIGTEIPKAMPILGTLVVAVLRGGDMVGAETLKRLFALHVIILPLTSLAILVIHLTLVRIHGISTLSTLDSKQRTMPFYPSYAYRDLLAWVMSGAILYSLCLLFPVEIGSKADALLPSPAGIKPAWYFLPFYEALRLAPASILGLTGEFLVNAVIFILGLLLVLVPFLDRRSDTPKGGWVHRTLGIAAICYMIVSITLAMFT